jgi:hypothetical protein
MFMNTWRFIAACLVLGLCISTKAQSLEGTFKGDGLVVTLKPEVKGFAGEIQFQGNTYPAFATITDGSVIGSFVANNTHFEFTGKLEGKTLTLTTAGKTYTLVKAAVNPLGDGGNNAARNDNAVGGMKDYKVIGQSKGIESLFVAREDLKSARKALGQTMRDLSAWLDAKPALAGAMVDTKDLRATATFTGKLKGQAVKGIVTIGAGDKGSAVSIVYGLAEVPDVQILRMARSISGEVKWVDARSPDGSATMKLPEGWLLTGASNGAVDIAGPDGQAAALGIAMPMITPEGERAWLQSQAAIGMQPRPSGLMISPMGKPSDILAGIVPQLSAVSERSGAGSFKLDRIIEATPIQFGGNPAEVLLYRVQVAKGQYRANCIAYMLASSMPIGDGKFLFYYSVVLSPEERFAQDLPTLLGVWGSWKVSDRTIRERMEKALADMKAGHEFWKQARDYHNQTIAKTNADFGEMIRGYRTVEDTRTGERTEFDLVNAKKLVEKMNEAEGWDRYREIPARDEVFLW